MKNVIIAGVSRAGKSTLAKKIAKDYQMSYIPFDSIVSTLEELYPQTGISHQDENIEMSKSIAVFLKGFMKHLEYEDINYVLDLYQVFPSDIKDLFKADTHILIYLGYPYLCAEDKLIHVRKHAREKDWTNRVEDAEMIRILDLFIKESKLMENQCKKEHVDFFDTGELFEETLNNAYSFIKGKIQ